MIRSLNRPCLFCFILTDLPNIHVPQLTVYPFFLDELPVISIDPFFIKMASMGGKNYIAIRETIDDQMSLLKVAHPIEA